MAKLTPENRKLAEAQRTCPIQEEPLGSMGIPIKVDLESNQFVFVCCKGCIPKVKKDPDAALEKAAGFKKKPPAGNGGKP
jgi:hypothetical protein